MNVVAHNLRAMNSARQYNISNRSKKKSVEKLASGYKINRSADDAAGLSISEKMRAQIRGLNQGAEEMEEYSMHNILEQAGQSVLAQANRSAEWILSLLG